LDSKLSDPEVYFFKIAFVLIHVVHELYMSLILLPVHNSNDSIS
jgi:hypothetical protein